MVRQGAGRVGAGILVNPLQQRSRFLGPTARDAENARALHGRFGM